MTDTVPVQKYSYIHAYPQLYMGIVVSPTPWPLYSRANGFFFFWLKKRLALSQGQSGLRRKSCPTGIWPQDRPASSR